MVWENTLLFRLGFLGHRLSARDLYAGRLLENIVGNVLGRGEQVDS